MGWVGKSLAVIIVAGAGAGGYQYYAGHHTEHTVARATPPVPIVAGRVGIQDFAVFQSTIGTVQAYNSVLVRARVDGQLDKVAFTEGQEIKANDVLAIIDQRPFQAALEQAEAIKAKDEAQMANAQRDLQRYVDLRDFASKQSLDTQRTLVAQLTATLQGDRAAIDNAKTQLDYTTIRAPLSGRAGARLIDQGNMVRSSEGTGLLSINQIKPIIVMFTLPQDVLDDVVAAEKRGPVRVDAYKRDDKTAIDTGTLTLIDNQIDPATGTIRFKAAFANEATRLWPGQFVNVHVMTEVRPKAVVVAAPVVQRGPTGQFAFVVKPDNTVEQRPIVIGPSRNGITVVESGLQPNEVVVVDGQYKLRPNVKVDVGTSLDRSKTASN